MVCFVMSVGEIGSQNLVHSLFLSANKLVVPVHRINSGLGASFKGFVLCVSSPSSSQRHQAQQGVFRGDFDRLYLALLWRATS